MMTAHATKMNGRKKLIFSFSLMIFSLIFANQCIYSICLFSSTRLPTASVGISHVAVLFCFETMFVYIFCTSCFQVTLDSFTIGRFTSYTQDGCPDGYMQMAESARTPIGGMWCGTSWGPVLFYSESRSLIFTIKLNK